MPNYHELRIRIAELEEQLKQEKLDRIQERLAYTETIEEEVACRMIAEMNYEVCAERLRLYEVDCVGSA